MPSTNLATQKRPASQSILDWCKERAEAEGISVYAARWQYYASAQADRPRTVILHAGGNPRVVEPYGEWKARMADRWSAASWCRSAGVSLTSYYRLSAQDRPRKDEAGHIIESAEAWWARMAKAKEAATA